MRKNLAVLLTIGLIIGINVFVFESLQDRNTAIERQKPQCSHWCLVTTAALLGLPMSIDHAMKRLPPDPAGHSLLAVKQSLAKVGIRCVGKKVSMKDIETTKFPAIVHLQEPSTLWWRFVLNTVFSRFLILRDDAVRSGLID